MRLLHAGPDHECNRPAAGRPGGEDAERVREGMSGNLCRCGAYVGITEAVLDAQKAIGELDRKHAA